MDLTEIMPLKDWERFEKELFDRFHINCTVYNVSGLSINGKPNWSITRSEILLHNFVCNGRQMTVNKN